jgi:hypothetical protein
MAMIRKYACLTVLFVGLGCATSALAQQPAPVPAGPPTADPDQEPASWKERLKEPDQGGGLHFTKHWAVAFGGIKQGSAIALGPAFSNKFENGSYVQLKAVYSLKQFKLFQARFDTPRFWGDRAIFINRVRWQDGPELSLYRLGMGSANLRADYAERKTEVSTQVRARLSPHVTLGAGFGVERFSTRAGDVTVDDEDVLPVFPEAPGLNTHPWFLHGLFGIGYDTRTSPDYSRTGHVVAAALHLYQDTKDNQGGFQMYEFGAQQLVPLFGEHSVLDLSGRTWLTDSDGLRSIPFYLMPTLGGGDFLRAFPTYRFRDREAWYVKAEYRWAVHKMADVAGFYEAGQVASALDQFNLNDKAPSVGLGIRVHSKKANLFRADLAHGREGWGFRVGFNAGGS